MSTECSTKMEHAQILEILVLRVVLYKRHTDKLIIEFGQGVPSRFLDKRIAESVWGDHLHATIETTGGYGEKLAEELGLKIDKIVQE